MGGDLFMCVHDYPVNGNSRCLEIDGRGRLICIGKKESYVQVRDLSASKCKQQRRHVLNILADEELHLRGFLDANHPVVTAITSFDIFFLLIPQSITYSQHGSQISNRIGERI